MFTLTGELDRPPAATPFPYYEEPRRAVVRSRKELMSEATSCRCSVVIATVFSCCCWWLLFPPTRSQNRRREQGDDKVRSGLVGRVGEF